jgi:hypothetical protein
MDKLTQKDLLDIAAYEKVRDQRLGDVIELKKRRRVHVGDKVTLVFENRETMRSQVQEMMRAERLVHETAIQGELDVYNELIPGPGELSATLFVEVDDPDKVREVLDRFIGLDRPGTLAMWFEAGMTAAGEFESGHSREGRISAVHFLRFRLDETACAALRSGNGRVELRIDHPNYRASGELSAETRRSLAEDLAEEH